MDKTLRNVIIAGILFVSISFTYYFFFSPKTEFDACYAKCAIYTNTKKIVLLFAESNKQILEQLGMKKHKILIELSKTKNTGQEDHC